MLAITNTTIYTPARDRRNTALLVEGSRISRLAPTSALDIPPQAEVIDGRGLLLVPGYLDLQLNGAFGHDFTADPSAIWEVSARLPQFGVTAYLPTLITSPLAKIKQAMQVLRQERPPAFTGADPLGLHIEGPFLNPGKKGAHNPAYLRQPDETLIAGWTPDEGIRLVTLAPELPGALPLIAELAARGIVVGAGHSLASYEEAQAGIAAGIRYGTHLFNAMTPLTQRQPGLPAAMLTASEVVTGLIADGFHVHPALIKIIWSLKGCQGLNLVSDAMAALGMPPGQYMLNEFAVSVNDGQCRLADGTIAGSVLPLDAALRNLLRFTGCTLPEALATVTSTPARLLGIAHERGQIAAGHIADLLLLTSDLEVQTAISAGQIVHQS